MAVPDGACRGIDVRTETGTARYNGRTFDVEDRRHIRMLRDQGAFPADVGGVTRAAGFPCPCGFKSLFRRCSRCGRDNPKEN